MSSIRKPVLSDVERPPRIPLARPTLPPLDVYSALLEDSWERRRLSNDGPLAHRFEAAAGEYGAFEHCVATANCDLALTLLVAALELPPGARVLLPSYTFGSTLHALLWNGLSPHFVDVDRRTCCLDPEAVALALEEDVALVIATHAFGASCDMPRLEQLCADAGAALVADGAQAFGTWVDGEHVGVRATATAFSFSATKVATSGEGGLVATADPELAERLRVLRSYGRDGAREESLAVGLNAKLSELHAALGVLALESVEAEVAAREIVVARYAERLADLDGVRLQEVGPAERPSRTFLAVDLGPHRDAVEARLAHAGIQTRRYFRPLHEMPRFASLRRDALPATEALGRSALCLPLFAELGLADVDEICAGVRAAVEDRG